MSVTFKVLGITFDEFCYRYVLRQILSGEAAEVAVEAIHEYLRNIGEEIRAGKIPLEDFIINKVSASGCTCKNQK